MSCKSNNARTGKPDAAKQPDHSRLRLVAREVEAAKPPQPPPRRSTCEQADLKSSHDWDGDGPGPFAA